MANLLQKASIVLTPTAYDNGKVLCAKPSEPPYGDFDFSRNSAATRVNAQGLVENVQILSSNLVQNGDFSEDGVQEVSNGSFSQEGSELITNGNFSNGSTDWILDSGWSVSDDKALCNGTNLAYITQTAVLTTGKSYKVQFDIVDYTSGSIKYRDNGFVSGQSFSGVGSYTDYVVAGGGQFRLMSENFIGSIDNVSVREVGQDWDLSSSNISIGEDKLVCNNVLENNAIATQVNVIPVQKQVKVQFHIVVNSGSFRMLVGSGGTSTIVTTSGTYTFYETSGTGGNLNLQARAGGFDGSITNISVKEVGMDWLLGGEVTIGDNLAHFESNTNTYSYIRQDIGSLTTKTYKIQLEVKNYVSGEVQVLFTGSPSALQVLNVSSDGVYTAYLTPNANGDDLEVSRNFDGGNFNFDITNISVIEITDDTNLPRINYEGFSYQDALGSELVTNGDFSNGSTDWTLNDWTIADGKASLLNGSSFIIQNNILEIGKTYKIQYTISDYVSGTIRWRSAGVNGSVNASNGVVTDYITVASTSFGIQGYNGFTGSIDNVSVKEYLGQEVVPDSGCGSWLFEPQSTNLVTYSEDLSTYTTTQTTVSTTTEKSPIKSVTPFLITEIAATNQHYIGGNSISLSGNNTLSCFVKNVSLGRYFKMWGLGLGAINEAVIFDTNTETIYEPPTTTVYVGGSAKLEDYGNGWFRCSITINTTITSFLAVGLINTVTGFGNNTYLGDITKSVLMTGIQIENQSYATSYIPTDGTTVTRNQDVCNNGGSLASINSTEGVFYAEIAANNNDLTNRVISLSDGSTSNRVSIVLGTGSNQIRGQVLSGGTSFDFSTTNYDTLNKNKIAISYKLNDFKMYINGVEVATDTSGNTPIGLNTISFNAGGTSLPFYGKTKALAVWKEALSEEELADLTYPTPTDPTFSLDFNTIAEQFTFARGSEATYVDAQGLIKSTNEIGPEEITNGDFSTDGIPSTTSWSLGWYSQTSNVLISGGKLTLTNSASQSSALAYATDGVSSLNVVTVNKTYKLQYRVIENNGVTSFKYYSASGSFIVAPTDLGVTHTIYIKNTANQIFLFQNATTNSSISIDNVSVKEVISATNTPRLDYSTGAEAFLLEPQSTNLITQSELFSDASWSKSYVTIIDNNSTSPDGNNNSSLMYPISSGNTRYINTSLTNGSAFHTISFFVKASGKNVAWLYINSSSTNGIIYYDLSDKTMQVVSGSVGTPTGTIKSYTNDWYKITYTLGTASVLNSGSGIGVCDAKGDWAVTANGTDGIEIWGAQTEALSYATSYIPTSGSIVTRNQETCINATPEINSEEGVLYVEVAALANDGTSRRITLLESLNDKVSLILSSTSNSIQGLVVSGGSVQFNQTFSISNTLDFNKIAFKYKTNDFAIWVNGVEVATDTSGNTPIGLSELSFADGNNTSNKFFGNTKDVQVYTKALSDAELIKLTT